MKAIVRDDIISLETFVALRFKYEQYAEMLNDAGGYCFVDQFVEHFGGKNKGRYLAKQLEDNGIISTKFLNNYKYCYLTDAAIKYLTYKDDPRDFSALKKADIPVKKITPNPSDKVLFSSAMKFALMQKYRWIGKKVFIKIITSEFQSIYGDKISLDEHDPVATAVNKTINYYDKSKIIFVVTKTKSLQMLILDTGNPKSANSYIILLKDYLKAINLAIKKIDIVILSSSQKDADELQSELNKKVLERNQREQELREKYPIQQAEPKKVQYRDELERWREQEYARKRSEEIANNKYFLEQELRKLNAEIPPFRVTPLPTCYYMKHYKDKIAGATNYIKPKDQSRFEELKKSLTKK